MEHDQATRLQEANERRVVSALVGDRALQLVADGLRSLVRETDTVSRHGGDEFLILLADGMDAKTLIDRADTAMYFAKKQAGCGFVFHADQSLGQSSLPAPAVQIQQQRSTHHELELAEYDLRHERLREANEQLEKISSLVSALLDPAQISQIESSLRRQSFEAADSIEAAVEACRPVVERRHQSLEATIRRPLEIDADPAFLTQILMSLLTNASVYTQDGGRIRVEAGVADGRLRLVVVDSGRDASPQVAHAIADPFVLDPRDGIGTGSGIDLRIAAVREPVEAHGGTVDVECGRPSGGVTMTIVF